jgi:nickel-dependent lactate racemase|tara:strand:- start:292 stop:1560 length:1269 start_codon:yes stop_codon:yes gene_type:complete
MKVKLQYGRDGLDVSIPSSAVEVIEPTEQPAIADARSAFQKAVDQPIGTAPLRQLIGADDSVAIVIPDITRPLPSHILLPWLLETIDHVPDRNIVIVNGTASHRPNTEDELVRMVGAEVYERINVVNHNAYDKAECVKIAEPGDAPALMMNRHYVGASKRILLGFIEPHLMAGFSGGYKAIFPGITDIDSIMHYHRASVIGDARSTWGEVEGNPTQMQVRSQGLLCPADFCINVTLNPQQEITRYFCGDVLEAHDEGCAYVKANAMVACRRQFPIVVTTNAGFPLDQNLYQSVKGMSAAAKVVKKGGLIISAAKCEEGFPQHGNFKALMHDYDSPRELLDAINAPGFSLFDQWEAQVLAMIQLHARVALYSDIPDDEVTRAFITPTHDIEALIQGELSEIGKDAAIAILPDGFMAVPYVGGA